MGGLVLFGALFLILFHMTYVTLLLYAVAIAIGYPILLVPYSSLTYDVIGKARYARKARIEYIVVREVFLNIGRIVSILVFAARVAPEGRLGHSGFPRFAGGRPHADLLFRQRYPSDRARPRNGRKRCA